MSEVKLRFLLFIIILLSGCQNNQELFILFDNVGGLKKNAEVSVNGKIIGEVKKLSVNKDYKILVNCKIEAIQLSVDSRFEIKNYDILGTKFINIIPGKSKDYINDSDTVVGFITEYNLIDSILVNTTKIINSTLVEFKNKPDSTTNDN